MTCPREDELLDALQRRYVGAEPEAHVASCKACTELRDVAGALIDDRADAVATAAVPSAGTMWWRMLIRQRHDAAAAARRSLLIGQAVTLAAGIALLVGFFGRDLAFNLHELAATIGVSRPLLIASAAMIAAAVAGAIASAGGAFSWSWKKHEQGELAAHASSRSTPRSSR